MNNEGRDFTELISLYADLAHKAEQMIALRDKGLHGIMVDDDAYAVRYRAFRERMAGVLHEAIAVASAVKDEIGRREWTLELANIRNNLLRSSSNALYKDLRARNKDIEFYLSKMDEMALTIKALEDQLRVAMAANLVLREELDEITVAYAELNAESIEMAREAAGAILAGAKTALRQRARIKKLEGEVGESEWVGPSALTPKRRW